MSRVVRIGKRRTRVTKFTSLRKVTANSFAEARDRHSHRQTFCLHLPVPSIGSKTLATILPFGSSSMDLKAARLIKAEIKNCKLKNENSKLTPQKSPHPCSPFNPP